MMVILTSNVFEVITEELDKDVRKLIEKVKGN